MTISLLPNELRRKEEEEKQKTKEAQGLPKFALHLPEEKKINGEARKEEKTSASGMEFGQEETALLKKGVFRIVKRDDLPSPFLGKEGEKRNLPPAPSLARRQGIDRSHEVSVKLPPAPPLIKREPEETRTPPNLTRPLSQPRKEFYKMRVPEIQENLNEHGKQIIRETTDKIAEIRKPPPLVDFLKTKISAFKFKKPPAEVNLISDDYAAVAITEFWRRIKIFAVIVLIFCLVCVTAFFAIKIKRNSLVKQYIDLSSAVGQAIAEINSFSMERAQAEKLKDRAAVMKILLKNHLYWTKIFDFLEHNIAENVYYTNFAAESKGLILLTGKAKSYTDVAKQLYIFENSELLKSAAVNSAGKEIQSVVGGIFDGAAKDELSEKVFEKEAAEEEIAFNVVLTFKDEALVK